MKVSIITVVYNTQTSGGALVSGEFQGLIIRIDGSGGALVTGTSVIGIAPQVSGGVSVGGIPVIEDSFFNKARNKGHIYSIGEGVYLRYEPKNNLPSRYERRTVEGLRFFGERNLYDVGIGILVDEGLLISDLNIDVVRSDEAYEISDWAENQTEDLENTIPSSDPIGGVVADTGIISDGGATEAEIEVSASDKINDIDSLTPISDPIGGVVVSSSETFNPQDRTSAILNKMKVLQDATVLPDPVGGTLRVTSVDSNRFENVANKAMARLEALQNTTVIPDPLGGSLMTTYSEGLTPDNVTSVQNSMNGLEDVVLLPGPSGAYIIVSIDTEGLNSFKPLESDAIDKIKELGIHVDRLEMKSYSLRDEHEKYVDNIIRSSFDQYKGLINEEKIEKIYQDIPKLSKNIAFSIPDQEMTWKEAEIAFEKEYFQYHLKNKKESTKELAGRICLRPETVCRKLKKLGLNK